MHSFFAHIRVLAVLLLSAGVVQAGPPAARLTDPGHPAFHAGSSIVAGSSNVSINGLPVSRLGDSTLCPQVCLIPFPFPHSPGLITSASGTVLVNGVPAARVGDTIIESGTPGACQPVHSIFLGSPNVFIGN